MLATLWIHILIGTSIVLVGGVIGWAAGAHPSWWPVRLVASWIELIVHTLLRCQSWLARTLLIFTNNALVLAIVLAAGIRGSLSVAAIVVLSLSLGIAVRQMTPLMDAAPPGVVPASRSRQRLFAIGVALNLLEPPAIALVLGMSLARSSVPLDTITVWRTYLVIVAPLLLAAAAGESLWLGIEMHRRATALGTRDQNDAANQTASRTEQ